MFYQVKLIRHKEYIVVGLPWWFSGWDLILPRHRAWVQFRVGDLRSHMPHSAAKKTKKQKNSTLGMISFLKSSMMTKFRIVVSCYKGWAGKEHEEIFWGTRNILYLFTIWLEVTGVHMEIKIIKPHSWFNYLFIFGPPSLHYCPGFSLVPVSRGYSPVALCRLLIVVTSLVAEHRLQGTWDQ